MDLHGIGPAGAARILADVGDIARFPDRNHFASRTGTAPIDASSGDQIRHRLSRAGNRRLNHVLHMAAIAQIRLGGERRTYYRRKLGEAETCKEARRCLERRLSDMVYRQLVADAQAADHPEVEAGPGGHSGASLTSSAADLHTPVIGSSDQPQPGPAIPTLPAQSPRAKTLAGSAPQPPRRRAHRRRDPALGTEGNRSAAPRCGEPSAQIRSSEMRSPVTVNFCSRSTTPPGKSPSRWVATTYSASVVCWVPVISVVYV